MVRGKKPLTALQVKTLKAPGRHGDGRNLYLNVTRTGARSWVFLYVRDGKQREMGLGSAVTVTLQEARAKAQEASRLLAQGGLTRWQHGKPVWRPGAVRKPHSANAVMRCWPRGDRVGGQILTGLGAARSR